MADFHAAFDRVLEAEGGWKDHTVAGDRGGRTFAGISERAHPDWRGWQWLDSVGPAHPTVSASVKKLYRREYWDRVADGIEDQRLAEAVYAMAVHSGVKVARGMLADADGSVDRFALLAIRRYLRIVDKNKTQRRFLRGWVRRALTFAGV